MTRMEELLELQRLMKLAVSDIEEELFTNFPSTNGYLWTGMCDLIYFVIYKVHKIPSNKRYFSEEGKAYRSFKDYLWEIYEEFMGDQFDPYLKDNYWFPEFEYTEDYEEALSSRLGFIEYCIECGESANRSS